MYAACGNVLKSIGLYLVLNAKYHVVFSLKSFSMALTIESLSCWGGRWFLLFNQFFKLSHHLAVSLQ